MANASVGMDRSKRALALRIHEALAPAGSLAGISIHLLDAEGSMLAAFENGESLATQHPRSEELLRGDDCSVSIDLGDGSRVLVCGENEQSLAVKLVGAIVRDSLRAMETEQREELLLEELGENWESLEALYEISTNALRLGDTKDALRRLLERLTDLQDGLHSALFIRRQGLFHPLVGTRTGLVPLSSSQLGPIEKALGDMQLILINNLAQPPDESACWRKAASLAAAPFAWEGSVGFVVLWNEEPTREFDSSVSRILESITYQASVMMQSDRLHRKVRESELLAQEIDIASSIQQTLLLANAPTNLPAFEIAACSVPSQRIDGDFHEFFKHPGGAVDVLIGDVMGKGVPAALLGAATKSQFLRALANLALLAESKTPHPAGIVSLAAISLSERLIALDRFVTLSYARFDPVTRRLTFVDCGHTSMICESKSRGEYLFLRGDDLPLGVLPEHQCTEHSIEFRAAETFLLYSDGVTECRSPAGELFGAERLAECVQNWSSLGPALLVAQIQKEAARFTESEKFSDDFTCVAVKVKLQDGEAPPIARRSAAFPHDSKALAAFRSWLRDCAELVENPLTEDDIARLQLACVEIFANCVIHLSEDACTNPIEVECEMFTSHISVQMSHPGPTFDPMAVPSPSFDGSRETGFGIYIVLRSADEASFTRLPDGTNLTTLSFLRSTKEPPS